MVLLISPASGAPLHRDGDVLADPSGNSFPVVGGIPRFCPEDNYTQNFGKQWNLFSETQIDRPDSGQHLSERRFFATTAWCGDDLEGLDILEVGSGAGRFSRTVLERTGATLWSVDYSNAVEANLANNGNIAPDRFHLFQASIYELPFPNDSFDKVFCMGVLQHTPDFEASVRSLVEKAKKGGEIAVDFYPIKGFWTKIHAKYLLRPLTKRMSHERLLALIDKNADWMIKLTLVLQHSPLKALSRFLPICDIDRTLPKELSPKELREWVVLDTFDMFSPAYDNPQRIADVAAMFQRAGASVTFADFVHFENSSAAVVRAVKN